MDVKRIHLIRQRISALTKELVALEAERDEIISKRLAAKTAQERRALSGQAGAVYAKISAVERRIRYARRLIARSQGDEFPFAR